MTDPLRPPETDDDPRNAARGCAIGWLIGALLWVVILGGAALLVNAVLR